MRLLGQTVHSCPLTSGRRERRETTVSAVGCSCFPYPFRPCRPLSQVAMTESSDLPLLRTDHRVVSSVDVGSPNVFPRGLLSTTRPGDSGRFLDLGSPQGNSFSPFTPILFHPTEFQKWTGLSRGRGRTCRPPVREPR